MNTQTLSLIIAAISLLSSLIVASITLVSSILSKKLDAKEKQEDRNQELRKLYITRKIQAGEAAIGKWTVLLNKLKWLKANYASFLLESHFNPKALEKFSDDEEKLDQQLHPMDYVPDNSYYFYFADDLVTSEADSLIEAHRTARLLLDANLADYYLNESKLEQPRSDARILSINNYLEENRKEFATLLTNYLTANDNLRQAILDSCTALRNSMANYDLSSL